MPRPTARDRYRIAHPHRKKDLRLACQAEWQGPFNLFSRVSVFIFRSAVRVHPAAKLKERASESLNHQKGRGRDADRLTRQRQTPA
jgi:hypothetical protein